jgi:rubredoxin
MSDNLADLFICKNCDWTIFEEVMHNVTVLSTISYVDENGYVEYAEQSNEDGDVDRYQCSSCGFPIRDEDGDIALSDDLAVVLRGTFKDEVVEASAEITRRQVLAAALETPGDLNAEELRQAHGEIIQILLGE